MINVSNCVIKSFKHNGHVHRVWQQNWLVPHAELLEPHQQEDMIVIVNEQTPILEANGKKWVSRVPAVSFFIPGCWYNIVALLEESGVRYYCNIASPPYYSKGTITYIDYDLDVLLTLDGRCVVVDQDEYLQHKDLYHYSTVVEEKVKAGLDELLNRIRQGEAPFDEQPVKYYYNKWMELTREE